MKIPRTVLSLFSFIVVTLAQSTPASAADFSAIWDGGNGNWDDPLHWNTNPNYPNNSGGVTYDATINGGNVTLDRDITIQQLIFNGGTLSGPSELTLEEGFHWNTGTIGLATINLAASSSSTLVVNNYAQILHGTINNAGAIDQTGSFKSDGTVTNLAGATWTMRSGGINAYDPFIVQPPAGQFNNAGSLIIDGGVELETSLHNTGSVTLTANSSLSVHDGSGNGSFSLGAQANLTLGYFGRSTLESGATINGGTTTIGYVTGGTLDIAGAVSINSHLVNQGTLLVEQGATLALNGPIDQLTSFGQGVTRLNGGTIASAQSLNFHSGTLAGWGTINSNLSLSNTVILSLQLAGTMTGSARNHYDSLTVNGSAALGGTLGVTIAPKFENTISSSDTFTVLSSTAGITGSFFNATNGSRMDTADYLGTFAVNYSKNHLTLSSFIPNTRWLGGYGNWTDGTKWLSNPSFPNDTPTTHYSVLLRAGDYINLDTNITISRFLLTGGFLVGGPGRTLTITSNLVWTGGSISNFGSPITVTLAKGSTTTIARPLIGGAATLSLSFANLNNAGTVNQSVGIAGGAQTPSGDAFINNLAGATWNVLGGGGYNGTFNNSGHFVVDTGSADGGFSSHSFNNNGNVTLRGSGNFFVSSGINTGVFEIPSGFNLRIILGTYTFGTGTAINGSGVLGLDSFQSGLNVTGNSRVDTDVRSFGTINITPGASLTLNGHALYLGILNIFSGAALEISKGANGVTPQGVDIASTRVDGTITSARPLSIGTLSGSGTINAQVSDNGRISPGASAGKLTINGNLSLLNNAKLVMEIGGVTQGTQYDYLAVSGMVGLDGTLELHMINGFQLKLEPTQTFTLLTSNSLLEGGFDNIASGARLTTADGLASFQVNYGAGSPYGANSVVLSDPQAVPEPASVILFAGGALALTLFRIRRR
jgi:hypothetical protein